MCLCVWQFLGVYHYRDFGGRNIWFLRRVSAVEREFFPLRLAKVPIFMDIAVKINRRSVYVSSSAKMFTDSSAMHCWSLRKRKRNVKIQNISSILCAMRELLRSHFPGKNSTFNYQYFEAIYIYLKKKNYFWENRLRYIFYLCWKFSLKLLEGYSWDRA